MQLWDQVILPRADELSRLSRAELADLATSTIERTTGLFAPPFAEYFPPRAAELVTSATRDGRSTAPAWQLDDAYLEQFTESLDAVQAIPMRPGCGPLTMAALSLVGGLAEALDQDTALEILSSCYEAILLSQLTGRVTLADEQQNEQCQRALAVQQDLISRFSGN
ncbi:MAG TPA: hypothetical protein VGN81_26605 [Pseudonocardiaceae bacterium]|jgi:hypothetical protein